MKNALLAGSDHGNALTRKNSAPKTRAVLHGSRPHQYLAPDGVKILPWLGISLIAVCIGADAQSIHKCVGKDGQTEYSYAPCPGSKEIGASGSLAPVQGAEAKKEPSARSAAASVPAFPEMQAGKWKLRVTREGRTTDSEMCGDPIAGFRREVQEYAANTKWGCTTTASASGPRSVRVVYDCPSDGSPISAVTRGRSEISVVSTSPQAFRMEMKSTIYPSYAMEGTRIGNCDPR